MNIQEILELLGHKTEVDGLHPFQQARFEEARSVLASIGGDSLALIGADTAWDVAPFFFAAKDKTGAKANDMGISVPAISYLGQMVDLGEVPCPVAFTVQSTVSRKAAVVILIFNSVNSLGYGALDDATCMVDSIQDDCDAADERVRSLGNAIKTLVAVTNLIDRRKEAGLRSPSNGPAF